ncbi:SsrA-binding protein, partial [Escherichia coli]
TPAGGYLKLERRVGDFATVGVAVAVETSADRVTRAGIALTGTEVKSLRGGKATIGEAYAGPSGEEMFLFNAYIPEYLQANR